MLIKGGDMMSEISTTSKSTNDSAISTEKAAAQANRSTQVSTASDASEGRSATVKLSREAIDRAKEVSEAERLAKMTPQELKAEAQCLLAPLNALTNDAAIARADQQVPNTNDPELLARAKQATSFLKKNAANPFAGMQREKLTSIIYDNSGAYTTNERLAAMSEQQNQDFKYWSAVFSESASRGDRRGTYMAAIDFYKKLSPLERAYDNYPSGYDLLMQAKLKEEEDKFGGHLKNDLDNIFAPKIELTPMPAESNAPGSEDAGNAEDSVKPASSASTNQHSDWSQMVNTIVRL